MRLLNVQSMKLEEYFGSQIPPYAILSHCWGSGEKEGAKKLKLASQQAEKEGLEYVWIDTCCIDKTSSAELSEAINSMYTWYEQAVVCVAYLEDIVGKDIENSKWFTRGWTLQELVAPTNIMFYDGLWNILGTKIQLVSLLSRITSISEDVLVDPSRRYNASVARKMSWASKRETTRLEDVAYSLLGIFNVNMPLLYGEGQRAFTRLQEEILKETDDHSLFAWTVFPKSNPNNTACAPGSGASDLKEGFLSILAESPANFRYSGNIVPYPSTSRSQPCSMTSRGLSIEARISNDNIAALECHQEGDFKNSVGIAIAYVGNENIYRRAWTPVFIWVPEGHWAGEKTKSIFIAKNRPRIVPKKLCRIDLVSDQVFGSAIVDLLAPSPRDCIWHGDNRTVQISPEKFPGDIYMLFAIRSYSIGIAFLVNYTLTAKEYTIDRLPKQDARIYLKRDEINVSDWIEKFSHAQSNDSDVVLNNLRTEVSVSGKKHTLKIIVLVERETIMNQQVTVLKVKAFLQKPGLVSLLTGSNVGLAESPSLG